MNNSFSNEQVQELKNTSIPFPLIVHSNEDENVVVEIVTVDSISGMADNNGMPTEINLLNHKQGKTIKKFTYRLTNVSTV